MTEEGKAPLMEESAESKNFILNFIDEDIAEGGRFQGLTVHTRFPPEPNEMCIRDSFRLPPTGKIWQSFWKVLPFPCPISRPFWQLSPPRIFRIDVYKRQAPSWWPYSRQRTR